MTVTICSLAALAIATGSGDQPSRDEVAGRVAVLGGPLGGLDVAIGSSTSPVWTSAVVLGGVGLVYRLGIESPSRPEPGITLGWYAGFAGMPGLSYSSNERYADEPDPRFHILAGGARLRFANASNFICLTPSMALLPGLFLGQPAEAFGFAPLYGQFCGAIPPFLEMGWNVAPNCWLSLRSALPFAAVRFDLGPP